jgi:cytochrome c
MSFAGIRSEQQRIDLIAYLRTEADSPAPIPPPKPAEAAPEKPAETAPAKPAETPAPDHKG